MASVTEHYQQLLADHYTWMFGTFADAVEEQRARFERWHIRPLRSGQALDLGSGSGFQSIALADMGFRVTAIDLSEKLLAELARQQGQRPITQVIGDIGALATLVAPPIEIAVCMGDTLPHLGQRADVSRLFADVGRLLEPGGSFIVSYRDLSIEAQGLARFIPVRSDDEKIMTCFLEYEPETVLVHDLIYTRMGDHWEFQTSNYRKLRLPTDWVVEQLAATGFVITLREVERGMTFLVATQS